MSEGTKRGNHEAVRRRLSDVPKSWPTWDPTAAAAAASGTVGPSTRRPGIATGLTAKASSNTNAASAGDKVRAAPTAGRSNRNVRGGAVSAINFKVAYLKSRPLPVVLRRVALLSSGVPLTLQHVE